MTRYDNLNRAMHRRFHSPVSAPIDPNNPSRRVNAWISKNKEKVNQDNWHILFDSQLSMAEIADQLESGELDEFLGVCNGR